MIAPAHLMDQAQNYLGKDIELIEMPIDDSWTRDSGVVKHGLCPMVANMFDNTRTTYTNRVVRFFAWNMPFHTEHHTYPTVPFHKLPELHDLMQGEIIHRETSYTSFTGKYITKIKR